MKLIKPLFITSLFTLLLLFYCHLETRWLKVKNLTIVSPDIPNSFVDKKFVFISDIHFGPLLSIDRVKNLVASINQLKPDFIVMGGDYVHRSRAYINPVFDELQKLQSSFGVYAVLGNHDHWEDAALTKSCMKKDGFKDCDNHSYWIRIVEDSIKIGGVGDLWEDVQIADSTIRDVKKSDFCILLSHNPDYLEHLRTDLVDLTLSGHTHGGQVTLFGLWAPLLPIRSGQKYRYGLIKSNDRQSYITSGVGTVTPPLRFFCRPEIVLITLKKQTSLQK
jgi:uncharacterized protein